VVSVTALRDAHGDIIGYLLIGTDNTAGKQVEAAQALLDQRLRDQQFYTRSLIESNIDALMMTDPQGFISDVNQQMIARTGRTRDELIGAPCKNFFTDPVRADPAIQRMPNMNGTDFLERVRALYPRTFRIVLSGHSDLASIVDAVNCGAISRYYTKPWNNKALRDNVRDAFRQVPALVS
jgi:PAS domain-containing protein